MLKSNTTLNENTETGDVSENLKIEAPELYETPDYTLPNEPSSYERKGFGFDQSNANKEDFIKYVYASRLIRELGGDEMLRRGGVMNCLYSINNMYRYIPANEAYREFFGGDIPIDQAEAELDRLYDIACNSEDALGKFLKLDDARQEKIIRQNVQGGKVKKAYTATGSSGGAIVADIDNPDFDMGKGREEYENILRAKNTWEGYLQLRNNFSPEVVRDAMRFKTATAESRSNVAEAVLIKMREKGPEYRAAFLASLDVLGVNIKDASDHNFFERAFTRISEAWTDSGVNMADKFWYSRTDGRVLYGMAEEMGLIDESGNLTEDASKLGKLKQAYEDSQNTAAIRALGSAGGWGLGSAGGWGSKLAYKDTEIQKLFDEGKENIETRRMYRNLRANLATQYNYSGDEWKTLEDMFVYGEYTLRAIGVSAATLAATKNPFMASLASVPMMFAEETARMYSELRLDAGLAESQASLLAMQYGVAVSAAEQFQLGRFMGSFVGKSAAKSFKEYVFNNFKGGVKKAIKEAAMETGVELSQNTYDLATKIFAAEAFGAGFNTDQLLDNYVEDFKSAALITPLITTFIFGVGAPFRFSGTLSNVGANYGTAAKSLLGIKPSEVVENNVETFETMRAAGEYEALVKSKYGATEQGRDFLLKYLNAKDSVERNSILQKRFPDAKERAEAKLFLENFKRLDSEAFDSILKVKIEAAQKREAEAQSILKGDTTDISALDAETTDEAGNISYEILNSAIDALGMRDDVVFVNNAQELAQASGMSLNAAEDVISRQGAKGFFDEKNGKIVIIKSHFASGADALQSFAHEYGHKIMAKIRANDLNGYKRMCSDVLDLIGGEAVARASLPASYSQVGHANYAKDSLDVAEESLMRVLEQVALKRVLDARKKSVWARFKGWFQKLFSEKSLADITNERLAQIALDVLQKEKSFNVSVPNAPSRNWRAKTPEADGEYVSGEWEVVDAGDLKTSLDAGYDDALQPRNRGRQSSKEQVLNIANNLDPELLDNDPRTSDGAPIVDSRSMAVSGNGRILAIRQAYESGKAEEYRRHVLSRANSMGIDVPAGIKNPVLIRRVMDTGNMSIEELAARSNKSSVAGMSVAEQAVADGRRISEAGLLDIFFPGADGNILAESNRDFNNAFLNLVGGSETFRNKDGSLRTNLSPRVRAAVLAAMLNTGGNRDIVERLLDNPEGYNALINGLMQCAANLAELAQKPQYDISGELSQAVELYIEMHDKGQTVAEFEAQPDMFREQPSAEVMFLCRLFENNQKTPSGISGVLKEYAAQCKKIDTTTADLFGEEDPSKLDKLQAAYDHYATDLAQGQEANARWKIDDPSPERVEKLRAARPVEIGENDYKGLYELNAKSAREYVLKKLRGKEYINADTGDKIEISQVGARKLLSHDRYNEDYLRSFAAIPQMIENSIFLGEEPNEKGKDKYDKYRYYACGLKIGGRDYTARLTIGESEGKWYYDQALTQIEKGDLIKRLLTLNSRVRPLTESPNGFIDNRLISLLQENSSKKWREADARRFASELQDFIDGKLDNKHVFRLGTTPEVLRLLGVEDLPIEMAASTLARKLSEHSELSAEDLKFLPHEIANPIAVFESSTIPNAFVVLTEITASNGKPVVAAIHCEKEIKRRNINVNDVRSVHSRNISQLDSAIRRKELRYINRKRIPSYLRLPLVQFHGRNLDRNVSPTIEKVLTESDLSQEELNSFSDLKWREVGEPSPEEIAEAKRQKAEVKAKWTNPAGSMKKGYMLAPNGRPTNLTEDQWLLVRTPNFKKWFGDWEKEAWAKAAMDFLERTAPVASLTGQEFQKDGVRLTDKVSAYFNSIGNVAHNEELGDVILDLKGVEDSIAHGVGRLKSAAFMAVPEVIEKGFIFNRENNWKERGWDTAVIVAPVKLGGDDYICEVVAKKVRGKQRFYLHEVEIKRTLDGVFKSVANNGNASQVSRLIIGKHLAEVKGNVSKVVDENGEPLVVYHGTRAKSRFNVFKGSEHFFSDNREVADGFLNGNDFVLEINEETYPMSRKDMEVLADIIMGDSAEYDSLIGDWEAGELSYNGASEIISDITHNEYTVEALKDFPLSIKAGGRIVEAFLNIRNPVEIDYEGKTWQAGKVMPEQDLSEHPNSDGLIGRNIREGGLLGELRNGEDFPLSTDYVVRDSTQIKSATDNAGTFNPENPDIRWREADSEVKRAVDEWASNPENVRKLAEEYLAGQKGQIVVDPDRIRAKLPNYEVSLNSDFVEAGDKVLEEVWKESLKRAPKDKPVVLLTGNPAAGKGTAKETGLLDWVVEANLVFDAPQNKFTSVEKRVKEAVNAGHSVRIIQIYNDPITSWRNSLKRGIGKDNPKTGMREGGRFLPMEYFVGVYESAQGKVEKIETILKQKYQNKLETKYIDSTGNNPIVVSPDEAKAWDYSISDNQLKEIERITDEYRGRIEESARLRGDKKDPLAVIGRGVSQSLAISVRGSTEKISRRTESGDERAKQSLPGEGGEGRGPVSRLKALLSQERSENPVIWASIVLAREILLDRAITNAKIDKVLPPDKFDGTKRQYALDRAKHIAEHCKATQKNYANRIDEAVKLAEIDVYWKHDVMEEMYRSYRKDGEEYGIAKQKLLDWIKNEQRKDLEKVKGFSSDELGIDVPAEIENALQEEPVRKKAGESQGETEDKEEIESIAEDGIDDEILGSREKLAPSSLRGIVDKIRIAVTKKVKARGGDEQTRRRVYRNTLVEVLSESAKELTYGREREAIMNKIAELSQKGYAVIKIKEGERAGQKIDNYTLRAEHIALRIFNRGVRDSKAQLLERFGGIIKRKGKKPSRMERDDKRKMAGAVQMRIYKIGKFAEMDAAELEAEYFAAVDKLNNAGVHFAGDSDNGETNKDFTDIEDIRAEAANTIADIQRFGNLREKSRADMAGAVEFLEKHIEEEMQKQEELIAKKKEEAAKKRKVVSDALRMSKHNAHKDGALRSGGRALINKTMPFDSLLAVLGEYATGETFLAFDAWRKDLVARIDRAAALVANETFRAQERLINIVEECYSENFSDALKRLLKPDVKYEEFSNLGGESEGMKQPMSLANVLQLYASALQENYRQNVYAHRAKKNGDVEKLQMKIDEILESYPDKESKKGEGWKSASEEIKSLENRIVGLQKNAVSDYIERIEKILTDADKKFVELLRKEYADALPALSAVSRRVIGLPIEQADALYIPVKIKREKTFREAAGQVPVVPKILSPRVQHMRDFDETANPISLYLDRVRENAQFKYFSELYIEMRSIFGSEELQDLISQRCGSNTLQELLDFIVDISTGQTRGYKDEYIQKANGLFALVALGFNLGSGVRQILPGCFSWGTYIGTPSVLKNMAAFFTPEGFSAALEIWRSENGRRRFSIGNLQIMEEMLATPDQNKFWALFKRYALVFNRASDMLAISFVGQGVYRAGVENYLRQGFNEAKAKEKAMADMWQIAERTQASGRMHNMARWQRRGGDLGKGIGMFSAPPQLMFSKSAQDIRRAIALGIKTPEGRVAAWQALKTWATVSILVEGSYAASGVLWNALLKGFFDDDDDERIIKQMATGPFGGLFLFGRMIENSTSNRGIESIMPVAGLARPAGNIYDLTLDLMTFDLDKALEDLDKLGKSTVPLYRDFRKVIDNRILEEN